MSEFLKEDEFLSRPSNKPLLTASDVVRILARRKHQIGLIFFVVLILAGSYIYFRPSIYAYTTTIEIGSSIRSEDGKAQVMPLEPPRTVVTKVEQAYGPAALQALSIENPRVAAIKFIATAPKETDLVVLTSHGPEVDEKIHLQIHSLVASNIQEDHNQKISPLRITLEQQLSQTKIELAALTDKTTLRLQKRQIVVPLTEEKAKLETLKDPRMFGAKKRELENYIEQSRQKLNDLLDPRIIELPRKAIQQKITQAKLELQELQDQARLLKTEFVSLDEKKLLITRQSSELAAQISKSVENRRSAVEKTGDMSAVAILLIDNEIQQNRNRLNDLEDRLYINLPRQRQELEKHLEDNRRAQEMQWSKISEYEGQYEKLLIEQDREVERQRVVVTQAEEKLETFVAENQLQQQLSSAKVSELEAREQKIDPDSERAIESKRLVIKELEGKLATLRETHLVVVPMRSLKPVGMSLAARFAIAGLIATVFAVFWVFGAEFFSRIRTDNAVSSDANSTRTNVMHLSAMSS